MKGGNGLLLCVCTSNDLGKERNRAYVTRAWMNRLEKELCTSRMRIMGIVTVVMEHLTMGRKAGNGNPMEEKGLNGVSVREVERDLAMPRGEEDAGQRGCDGRRERPASKKKLCTIPDVSIHMYDFVFIFHLHGLFLPFQKPSITRKEEFRMLDSLYMTVFIVQRVPSALL